MSHSGVRSPAIVVLLACGALTAGAAPRTLPDHPAVTLQLLRLSAPWAPGRFDLRRFLAAGRITRALQELATHDPNTRFNKRRDLLREDVMDECDTPPPICASQIGDDDVSEYVMFGSVTRDPIGFAVTIELVRISDHSVRTFTARTGDDEISFVNLASDGYRYLLHRM